MPIMPSKLRVGVVGLGLAGSAMLEGFDSLPDVELAAVADQDEDRAIALGERYHVASTFGCWKRMFEREQLDIVFIATPNASHCPIAIAAMSSGAHVLCEKPLAPKVEDALAMVKCAESEDRVLGTVFNFRERGDVQVLKQIVVEGALGEVYYVKVSWMRRRQSRQFYVSEWHYKKALSGGGPVMDLGVHILDLALYLLGEPPVARVSGATYAKLVPGWMAAQGRDMADWEVEDLGAGVIFTDTGTAVMFETSWASHGAHADNELSVALYGSCAGARLVVQNYATAGCLELFGERYGELAQTRFSVGPGDGRRGVARRFVDVVRTGDWSAHRGYEGLSRTRVVDALYRSADLGREVVLSADMSGGTTDI